MKINIMKKKIKNILKKSVKMKKKVYLMKMEKIKMIKTLVQTKKKKEIPSFKYFNMNYIKKIFHQKPMIK